MEKKGGSFLGLIHVILFFFPLSYLCFLQIDEATLRDVTTNQNLTITGNIQEEILNLKNESFFFLFLEKSKYLGNRFSMGKEAEGSKNSIY